MEPQHTSAAEKRGEFRPGLWTKEINVRNFIQNNYTPYYGDESFLAGPTKRTTAIWKKLTDLFVEERKKGVLDVSQVPSSITAHGLLAVTQEALFHHFTFSTTRRSSVRGDLAVLPAMSLSLERG